jgi:hypothetical protein
MSIILATYNINTQEWIVKETDLAGHYFDLQIGFIDAQSPIIFNNVSMGFELSLDSEVKELFQYPPENVTIHSSDQPYIFSHRLETEYSKTYNLKIWAKNAGVYTETRYQFETNTAPDYEAMFLVTHQYEVK